MRALREGREAIASQRAEYKPTYRPHAVVAVGDIATSRLKAREVDQAKTWSR